ncbi:hypothetical protein AHMF7605_10460 [Adhaeribacter arboris]|uniref:Uncharacterized protein n=1 Tax=Adhaeribacter arboris TaxID=2072846 RepID=A0A2T2YEH3_9BACT|nr:hypothetical protein [Adhaeribacter arboris]PSR53909.1 hypothetical protein AHMF7605_10460 [Adhaeribacter arboris]
MTKTKALFFNRPQKRFILSLLSAAVSIWSRATGKSTLIAWLMKLIVESMPRSKWALVGSTYKQILTLTLPSTIASLERLGFYKDKHYFIGRKCPAAWNGVEPYEPPLDYQHCIYFWKQGVVFQMVSQDAGGSGSRGANFDGIISDESLLLNKERYDKEVSAANRGNLRFFQKSPLHHGEFHFSSMPYGDQGKWLLDAGRYYQKDNYDFLQLQNELVKMQLEFIDRKDREFRIKLWEQMQELSRQIRFYPSKESKLLYSEANTFDNLENLGLKYLEDQRATLTDFVFLVEILNKRPGTVEAGFYPTLNYQRHTYENFNNGYLEGLDYNLKKLQQVDSRMDADCVSSLPLRLAVDWGSKISVLSVAQQQELTLEYRFLKGLYVKHPKLINDLADLFCDYYEYHLNKTLVFIEDSEWGNARKPDSDKTYNEQFIDRLKTRRWRVVRTNLGRVPSYQTRYHLAHEMLGETDTRLPRIRFNKHNCRDILTAMAMAPVKQGRTGEIEKDKSSEKKLTVPGQEATHFTDTVDLHLLSIDKHVVRKQADFSQLIMMGSHR